MGNGDHIQKSYLAMKQPEETTYRMAAITYKVFICPGYYGEHARAYQSVDQEQAVGLDSFPVTRIKTRVRSSSREKGYFCWQS